MPLECAAAGDSTRQTLLSREFLSQQLSATVYKAET